jgi:hypothetical protein
VVAHPPCRAWGRLKHFSKPRHDEKDLAFFAVDAVRKFGGVLEHPAWSSLWPAAGLPGVGALDEWGGWTLPVSQNWWGHKAQKNTWLYVVGCSPARLPTFELVLGSSLYVVTGARSVWNGFEFRKRPEISHSDRERSPVAFALWLVDIARRCNVDRALTVGG